MTKQQLWLWLRVGDDELFPGVNDRRNQVVCMDDFFGSRVELFGNVGQAIIFLYGVLALLALVLPYHQLVLGDVVGF